MKRLRFKWENLFYLQQQRKIRKLTRLKGIESLPQNLNQNLSLTVVFLFHSCMARAVNKYIFRLFLRSIRQERMDLQLMFVNWTEIKPKSNIKMMIKSQHEPFFIFLDGGYYKVIHSENVDDYLILSLCCFYCRMTQTVQCLQSRTEIYALYFLIKQNPELK